MSRPTRKPVLGISSCLLGEKVRFDGQHKKDDTLLGLLGPHVKWVSVCPEVEAGLGIPREPVRLVQKGREVEVRGVKTENDVTRKLKAHAKKKMKELGPLNLSGFILKKGSPSCGLERVKVYGQSGRPVSKSSGVFAEALKNSFPGLPLEEEGRLCDSGLRENFIERVFAFQRLQEFFLGSWSQGTLVKFHTAHKMQIMAHSPNHYRQLGRMVANGKSVSRKRLKADYETAFMGALEKKATTGKNVNVLEHMMGHFKNELSSSEKKEFARVIGDYAKGFVPLVVPVTLLSHFVNRLDVQYLKGQTFLEPNPRELMLRNHV